MKINIYIFVEKAIFNETWLIPLPTTSPFIFVDCKYREEWALY